MPTDDSKARHHIDVHVGLAVRNRRKSLGMTQPELGRLLNLSFQQVQRYETGDIRISASKLWEIARALDTSVCFFFMGIDDDTHKAFMDEIDLRARKLLTSHEGIEIADLFPKIEDANVRQHVVELVRALQTSEPQSA